MVWKATDAGSCPSCCGRTIAAPPLGPRRQLIDGRSAEGVGGADDDGTTIALEELRELADRGRLADAVDSTTRTTAGRSVSRSVVSNFAKCSSRVSLSIRWRSRGSVVRNRSTFSRSSSMIRSVMSGPKSAVSSAVSRSSHVLSSIVGFTNMPRRARPSDQEFSAMTSAYGSARSTLSATYAGVLGITRRAFADALTDHRGDAVLPHRDP
jgi:hypothetical protein